ncbi:hypothetical protein F7734_10400 [Scytonema sp. UIC 10036]|uniref:virulence-associated E family protein n=1 Tax=Scytonema sp. UIC 10036 TaxID=2304196 RepID=UPI0012DABCF9|nr:virulence-associated E family protein [Scytonema sp. UIC 10036]MUG92836.1 hypothetical protein [Scytonema sp. UIC 10036]
MKYNYTLADSSSVENSATRKIFVEDSWVYEESSTAAIQAFQKPILWVTDPLTARPLSSLFDLVQFGDSEKVVPGDHYLVVEKHTPEELVKACGWQLAAAGINCKVYRVKTSINYLLEESAGHLNYLLQENSGVSLSEITLLILDYSVSFSEWEATTETEQLTTRVAVEIARSAIAHLPEPRKSVELATLRKRCGEVSYDWNKLMGNLEEEFRTEQRKRSQQHIQRSFELESAPEPPFGKPSNHLKKKQLIEKRWGHRLRFNEMLQRLELDGEHLELDTIKTTMAVEFNMDISKEDAIDILFYLASTRKYHPVRDYLNSVASQHSDIDTAILNDLAARYFGNDSAIANIYMKKTLVGAVARVMEPGAKMDTMTILYGKQGTFKSTFWRKLVGNEFFNDSLFDLAHKDELAKLRRFWGLELAEIDYLFGHRAVESFKRFLSAQDDTYRPPYARENITIPRTCFFVGTTNKKELLNDPTGDRRYWVLDVLTTRIPYELLETERDKLWAAAVKLYRQGERWDLSEEEKAMAHTANEDYRFVDPWEDAILNYLLNHRKVTTQEILSEVLKLDIAQNDQQKQRRVIGILQRLGCESKTISRNGKKLRAWVYMPTLEEGNATQPDVTPSVTADVTAQIESQQAIQPAIPPVTSNNENFPENDENPPTDNSRNLIQTGVTDVTPSVDNTPNPSIESVLSGNAEQSEWMSEENLQAMVEDLESCENIEMFQVIKSVCDKLGTACASRSQRTTGGN